MPDYLHYISALVALAFAFILLIAGAGAMSAQMSDTERHYNRSNQTLQPESGASWENGSQLTLEGASINQIYPNETIYHNDTVLDEDEDYHLNESTGKIKWTSSSTIANNRKANATFHARGHPESAAAIIDISEQVVPALPWVFLVIVAFVVVALLVGVTFVFGLGATFRTRGGMGR